MTQLEDANVDWTQHPRTMLHSNWAGECVIERIIITTTKIPKTYVYTFKNLFVLALDAFSWKLFRSKRNIQKKKNICTLWWPHKQSKLCKFTAAKMLQVISVPKASLNFLSSTSEHGQWYALSDIYLFLSFLCDLSPLNALATLITHHLMFHGSLFLMKTQTEWIEKHLKTVR